MRPSEVMGPLDWRQGLIKAAKEDGAIFKDPLTRGEATFLPSTDQLAANVLQNKIHNTYQKLTAPNGRQHRNVSSTSKESQHTL